jgi:S-DNA-T family DNA segregation ATPase FtsK/SpoIIIE
MNGSAHRVRDGLGVLAIGVAVLLATVLFIPAEGRIAAPLHAVLEALLGQAAFVLPVGLLIVGSLTLVRSFRPDLALPYSRMAGLVLLALVVVPAQHFVNQSSGLAGRWLGGMLLDWLGGPATTVALVVVLLIGVLLAFDLTLAQLLGWLSRPLPRWRRLPSVALPAPPNKALIEESPAVEVVQQQEVLGGQATWRLPAVDVFRQMPLAEVSAADLAARARVIEETLATFNIEARVVEANQGPAVTQFGIEPAPGNAVSRVLARQNDLALRLGASPIRLEAPVPGKTMMGLEVPNGSVATVTLRDVLEAPEWDAAKGRLRLALGRAVSGKAVVGDLSRMPHLLIAGATGAGKSVCINTLLGSLLVQFTPDELQLVLIDPKRVELVGFGDLPHLRLPVIVDMDKVVGALRWVVLEMDRRYKLFAECGARNLEAYNRAAVDSTLPYVLVVIDELADMMMSAPDEVEKALCRLAQLARATGIHLIVATQRPSVDVLTGLIKANFPTRLAFAVASQTDSRVILDQAGADKLLGRGDALFLPTDAMKPIRLQGAFVSDEEILRLIEHWKRQGQPRWTPQDLEQVESLARSEDEEEDEDIYERGVELAEKVGRVSTSLLQRRLGIGRDRAQRLLDRLIDEGVAEA